MNWWDERKEGILLRIRVVPRAKRDEFAGLYGDRLKIRLQSPPVDGKANAALIRFLAARLALPQSRISLVTGERSRDKTVLLEHVRPADVYLDRLAGT